MKIRARPCARCSSRRRFRYWAWIVRSRLVVGSSAISRRGSQEMPMAPTMRWRMPPDISCGCCEQARLRRGDAHRLQQLARAAPGGGAAGALVHPDRLGHLVADREQRVQRGHRVLQDHGDALAAHVAHLGVGFLQQVLALEQHPAAGDPRRRRQQAQDGERQRALARTGLADDAQRLAGVDAQRDLVDRAHDPRAPRRDIVGGEVLELEQRAGAHRVTSICGGHGIAAQSWRSWGSSLTRSQSPRRFAESTISMMQTPGSTVSHQ